MGRDIDHAYELNETIFRGDEYSVSDEFWTSTAKTTGVDISADEFFLIVKKRPSDPDTEAKILKQTSDFTFSQASGSAVDNAFLVTCSGGSGGDTDIPAGRYYRFIKWVPSGSGGWTYLHGILNVRERAVEREVEA